MKKTILPLAIVIVLLVILVAVFTIPSSAGYSEYNLLADRNYQNLEAKVDALQILVAELDPTKLESRVTALEAENAAQAQALAEVKAENAAMAEAIEAMRTEIEAMKNAPAPVVEDKTEDTTTLYHKLGVALTLLALTAIGVVAIVVGTKKN